MTKIEVKELKIGVYRVYWKDNDPNYPPFSLAAIGNNPNGVKWIAPCNWVSLDNEEYNWDIIEKVELIEEIPKKSYYR